jgi:peroxiredoxin
METVQVGATAPVFCLPATSGEICLSDFRSKKAVALYFYPKDSTAG